MKLQVQQVETARLETRQERVRSDVDSPRCEKRPPTTINFYAARFSFAFASAEKRLPDRPVDFLPPPTALRLVQSGLFLGFVAGFLTRPK